MKIFADANILVSVLNREYPLFPVTSRILSLADSPPFRICTSPVCLAIAFYFAEKKYKTAAKEKVRILCEHIELIAINVAAAKAVFSNPAVKDLEDGLEYYAALEAGCDCILTEDKKGFYYSGIEVLTALEFYEKYMRKRK